MQALLGRCLAVLSDLVVFGAAVVHHWGTLMTGGVIIGLIAAWDHLACNPTCHPVPPDVYRWIVVGFLLVAIFQAWRDQYRSANPATMPGTVVVSSGTLVASVPPTLEIVFHDAAPYVTRAHPFRTDRHPSTLAIYRVGIRAIGDVTIRGARVVLVNVTPRVDGFVPRELRFENDTSSHGQDSIQGMIIYPHEEPTHFVTVVSMEEVVPAENEIVIGYADPDAPRRILAGRYVFTLRAEGNVGTPYTRRFIVDVGPPSAFPDLRNRVLRFAAEEPEDVS